MPLAAPNLDDRDFDVLLADARQRIAQAAPGWTDLSPGDPGIVLLEVFAYLIDQMIYRLNRLPQKAYVAFLRLMGVKLQPPAAARVELVFSRTRAGEQSLEIPRGTRVTLNRSSSGVEPPVFLTARAVTIPAGDTQAQVLAYHCDQIEGELAGIATGQPGLTVQASRPPIIAPTGDDLDLIVGVRAATGELSERVPAIQFEGQSYRIWREVENFTNLPSDESAVYLADRITGTIIFAPAARMSLSKDTLTETPQALAATPPAGREVRLWYRRGGGAEGNVAANSLTVLKDSLPGLQVNNPGPATGGRPAETLENALVRGPHEIHTLERAVTARDFELIAHSISRAIARAKALTKAALWTFALPGTVEVLLVPYLPDEARTGGQVTREVLHQYDTEEARAQIQAALDERRPMGIVCEVNWARYKTVRVQARVVVRREEDKTALRQRLVERLYQTINPLPTPINRTGWQFGQALRASNVYDVVLAEPGVRWVDRVRLLIEEVPNLQVTALVADFNQPNSWYAASQSLLFRSLNDGEGWEVAGRFPDEQIDVIEAHPGRAGLVAVLTHTPSNAFRVHISRDCGETWAETPYSVNFRVNDLAWTLREGTPVLLLATDAGLYELVIRPGASPVQLLVDPAAQNLAFYSVAVSVEARGGSSVAVAAQNTRGVYLSSQGGLTNTFRQVGLKGQDVRKLAVRYDGPRSFLWAGTASAGGDDPGKGCFSWELRGAEDPPEGWQAFQQGWVGGTVQGIVFQGDEVLAASHRAGVLRLDLGSPQKTWVVPPVNCGLPLRDQGRFHPVTTIAADQLGKIVMAGGPVGVYRSQDGGTTYSSVSSKEFLERVTLPATWLFVSGEHDITVLSEDEAS